MRGAITLTSLLLLAAGCDRAPALASSALAADPQPAETVRQRGLAIQLASGASAFATYAALLREIAGLGANSVLLSAAGYMEHARAQAIYIDARCTPSPGDFAALIREAHRLDLRVMVMPIVLLSHPRGSEWRGVIDPPDWVEWWAQYRKFVRHFADIAREGEAEAFFVGSELVSTEKYTSEWVKTIELVRGLYRGQLSYSANWDHYKPIAFWDKLDFVSMTSYYTLADHKNPSVDEIIGRWRPVHKEITDWLKTTGKPLVLTEVGWCSQEGAATAPWNYYQNTNATAAGHEEQRRLYEAFLRVWDGTPGLSGVIWWEWTAAPGGPSDFNYTPRGKPAEQVLRRWFAAGRETAAPSASP